MKPVNPVVECPKCGSRELGRGRHSGYSVIQSMRNRLGLDSAIRYLICTECGYIIEGYVEKPERFKDSW